MRLTRLALLNRALLLCIIAAGGQLATAQTAAPAPAHSPTPAQIRARVTQIEVNATIPDDPTVNKMIGVYSPKVRALESVIGKLKGDLRKGGAGAGSMGNFVTDALRAESARKLGKQVVLAVTNAGGLRKNVIAEGELKLRDVFELLPFENALVAFDLTGAQILDLLRIVVSRRDAQSGARIKYQTNADKQSALVTARFVTNGQEQEIDPATTYTVVSIDYLLNVAGGDYGAVLKQGKNIRPLGLTMRDAVTNYIKSETAAGREINATVDGRFLEEDPVVEMPND